MVRSPPAATTEIQSPPVATLQTLSQSAPATYPRVRQTDALPTLDQSDKALWEVLTGLFGTKAFTEIFYSSDVIRRFVVTVDNLPRKRLPLQLRPVAPAAGRFLTTAEHGSVVITSENNRRYARYVLAAEAVDTKKLVAAYVHLYPLFQQEYESLGYPSGTFNDRLIEAIDDLLSTPDVEGPVRLVQPNVMYEFADPQLEALSAGEKVMLRIGSDNAGRVKTKLREIRGELDQTFLGTPAQ